MLEPLLTAAAEIAVGLAVIWSLSWLVGRRMSPERRKRLWGRALWISVLLACFVFAIAFAAYQATSS